MALPKDQPLNIAASISNIKERIAKAAAAGGREAAAVQLIAISKSHSASQIEMALKTGHKTFGESRVQEAEEKWPKLKIAFPGVRLHMVGPLQRNKLRRAVALFDVLETIDRPRLAHALAAEMESSGKAPDCLIQVNTGEEPQKAGILPLEADAFIKLCRDDLLLPVRGLMCIPPVDEEPSLHFALLKKIADRNGLKELSMGMSGDFEIAARSGATMVRVGSAIFGERLDSQPALKD